MSASESPGGTSRAYSSGTAINPVTVVVKECILISSSMRKVSKYSQSGVAAILGGGSDLFNDSGDLKKLGLNSNAGSSPGVNDPLLSGFIQLRLMLNSLKDLNDVDSLTLLQPFLLVIKSSSTSGNITALALDSLAKFISYKIISRDSKNLEYTLTHIINSLTHCRFEASEQSSDDAVLLKVLRLLEVILDSELGDLLSDEIVYEVVQTSLSLACNKRRSEVLRKAAELTLYGITRKIFVKLDSIEPEHPQHVVEETQDYSKNQLIENIGPNEDISQGKKSLDLSEQVEKPFGLIAIKQFLGLLISVIAPENQLKHTETTKVFALSLIRSAVELTGDRFPNFPTLLNLIADPVFKHTLQIIQSSNNLPVLQSALQLFTTLALTLGEFLQPQIELTLTSIFKAILPAEESKDKNSSAKSGKSTPVDLNAKTASSKELIIEEISILWTRSPGLFVDLFVNYDCNFHRHDLTVQFIDFLARLSLPESALISSESVPPTCLEGLLLFISNLNDKLNSANDFLGKPEHQLLQDKQKKKEFIAATNIFNNKPKDGLAALADKGFIKSADDIKDIALFFYEKSSRLNKKVLGEFLAKPANSELLKVFMSLFQFKGLRVDEALRIILKTFRLPGESQQIERIVEAFAARYVETQKAADEEKAQEGEQVEKTDSRPEGEELVRPDADAVFVLSYSIIMLNTDLYNPVVKAHMTITDYKKNLKGVYGGKDFPDWYLEKIFQSIQDKEIVMPEEHHGSAQWFDDTWNNLIATNLVLPTETHAFDSFTSYDILQFERYIFKATFGRISSTVFKIFEVASDDQVVTKMMSTLDQLAHVAACFQLDGFVDSLVSRLAVQTGLTGKKKAFIESGENTAPLKLTRIKIENGESINVSETAVVFGSDFKAQVSTVVLFRVLKRNISVLDGSWSQVFKILVTLIQSGLIDPNLVPSFQETNNLSKLPKIRPEVVLTRSAATKGLFSTFASYLKGEDEPTDEEVESTLSALDCVKSANINSLFDELELLNDHKVTLIEASLEHLPTEVTAENKRYLEAQLFFVLELATALSITLEDTSYSIRIIQETEKALLNKEFKLGVDSQVKLLTYKLLLINHADKVENETITKTLDDLISFERKVFEKKAKQLIEPITKLGLHASHSSVALSNENYWKILRTIASLSDYAKAIFRFTESLVKSSLSKFDQKNFMWLLGLLDEVSAVGAIGSQWELEYDELVKNSKKVTKENPYLDIVNTSIHSIKLTSSLLELKQQLTKEETYALVQALAHQCLNPCIQIRSYALSSLEETVLQIKVDEEITADGIFELGLFPLLNEENIEKLEILTVISKVYLHFYKLDKADNQIFLKILDVFNQHIEDPKIETEMQKLITKKKELQKIEDAEVKEISKEGKKVEEETAEENGNQASEKDSVDNLEVE